uniref:BIG2 domain-containing protein n=1 Tax=Rhodnius prolixus TaxID=13249 RepID=T1H9E2_RHOPR
MKTFFGWIITLIFSISCGCASKLNVPRVLLPVFRDISVNFTLEVTGIGCYKWSSSRPDLVSVSIAPGLKCSRNAVVKVVTSEMCKNTAVVLAQEQDLGHILRADVILDVVNSLTMVTKTRKLHLDEPPELFEVRALDKYGNMFTSLLGAEFQWLITNLKGSSSTMARVMPFRESTYETPEAIKEFEKSGKQGYIALLEGLHMGSAKVSVKLQHPEYDQVPPEVVHITIVTSLILEPSHALIMKGDIIHFRLLQVEKLIEIDTLHTKYYLKSLDESIASISGFEVNGLRFGHVTLELYDFAVTENMLAIAEAKLVVVSPLELTLSVIPDFSIITGEPAIILSRVFSSEGQEILLGDKAHVSIDLPLDIFVASSHSVNGSIIHGRGRKAGNGIINATLITPSRIGSEALSTSTHLYVYPELSVYPSPLIFPWHPSLAGSYSTTLKASGGDGTYTWQTEETSVAIVNDEGTVVPTGLGSTGIHVYMKSHTYGWASADVIVIEPSNLELVRPLTQVEVGEMAEVYIIVTGLHIFPNGTAKKFAFSNCQHMQFNIKIDTGFTHDSTIPNESLTHGACAVVKIISAEPAISTICVSFKKENGNEIEKRTVVAAYEKLRVVEPISKTTTLAVGSSRQVVFDGGPIPFLCKVREEFQLSKLFNSLTRSVTLSAQNTWSYDFLVDRHNHYVIKVTCEKLGMGKLTLSLKAVENCKDTTVVGQKYSASLEVMCASPSVIRLKPFVVTACPRTHSNAIYVNKNSVVEFMLIIMDADGHKFDNATSLHYKWSADNSLVVIDETETVNLNYTHKSDYIAKTCISAVPKTKVIPGEHYKAVEAHDRTGIVHIQVACQENQVDANFEVIVVNEPKIVPNQVVIFNHPDNRIRLTVSEGSVKRL